MSTATWIVFAAYAAAAVALGLRAASRHDEGDAFWSAGRDLSALSVGTSLSASFLSISWSCVYAVQLFYGYGLGALLLMTVPWIAALAGIWLLARRYRELPAFSQPQMIGDRFGASARRTVAVALAFVFLVWAAAEIWVAAALLATPLATSTTLLVWLIGAVVASYSLLGGFRAVVLTDRLQYVLVVAYVGAMVGLAGRGLQEVGGLRQALERLPATGALSGRPWYDPLAAGAATVLLTFVAYLPGWLFETDLWLRVQTARDAAAARRGVAFAIANAVLFVGVAPAFIGLAALVLFPVVDGAVPPEVGGQGDAIFAALVGRYAPPWLQLLSVVGLLAAAMSTIDTCTNVVALSIGRDLTASPEADSGRGRARVATLGAVVAACLLALGIESLWDVFYLSSGVLTTAVAFPVAAVLLPWATPAMVCGSSLAGLAGTILAHALETRGLLAGLQPAWLQASGLGFICWGIAAATIGAIGGAAWQRAQRR